MPHSSDLYALYKDVATAAHTNSEHKSSSFYIISPLENFTLVIGSCDETVVTLDVVIYCRTKSPDPL